MTTAGRRHVSLWRSLGRGLAASTLLVLTTASGHAQQAPSQSGAVPPVVAGVPQASGLPLPRFVSLKSDKVNLRNGPGTDYPTSWVFRHAGLPLEVIKEFEGWRQVRDAEGTTGWVIQSVLSGRRTALISPWDVKAGQVIPRVSIRADDSDRSRAVAVVEAGVIANVLSCDGTWCLVAIDQFRGYIEQKKLWGVYDREIVK